MACTVNADDPIGRTLSAVYLPANDVKVPTNINELREASGFHSKGGCFEATCVLGHVIEAPPPVQSTMQQALTIKCLADQRQAVDCTDRFKFYSG